jgi:hypothetical protein
VKMSASLIHEYGFVGHTKQAFMSHMESCGRSQCFVGDENGNMKWRTHRGQALFRLFRKGGCKILTFGNSHLFIDERYDLLRILFPDFTFVILKLSSIQDVVSFCFSILLQNLEYLMSFTHMNHV